MDVDRMRQLAEHLHTIPTKSFNMGVYIDTLNWSGETEGDEVITFGTLLRPECGTCGCIAGHTIALFEPSAIYPGSPSELDIAPALRAAKILDISEDQAFDLFLSWPANTKISPIAAADRVEAMIAEHLSSMESTSEQ